MLLDYLVSLERDQLAGLLEEALLDDELGDQAAGRYAVGQVVLGQFELLPDRQGGLHEDGEVDFGQPEVAENLFLLVGDVLHANS